jgi:hypothetical protein
MSPVTLGVENAATEPQTMNAKPLFTLPEGYEFRALNASDFDNGLFECLAQLTVVNEVSQSQFTGKDDKTCTFSRLFRL